MFNKILVAAELVERCDVPVLTAVQIAKQCNSKLYILHVLESVTNKDRCFVKHYKTGEDILCSDEYVQTVEQGLHKYCADVMDSNLDYEIKVVTGFPFEEILRCAEEECIELVLMGPHTERARELDVNRVKGTIGSTAQGVILHERYPVMIINRVIPEKKLGFKKIMAGIDFSESCKNALRFAVKLAQKCGSRLYLFHMAPASPSPPGIQTDYIDIANIMQQRYDRLFEMIPKEIEYGYDVWEGTEPSAEILKYAGKNDVDLIVMGSHTEEENERWYLGSAVEEVSCEADCPVVVITDADALSKMDD
jgi:nucleotide-binding universal stress UspA family protein